MNHRLFEEEKGLFTFYKEQQLLQQSNQYNNIKIKKNHTKPCKSKRKKHSNSKSTQNKAFARVPNNEEEEQAKNKKPLLIHRQPNIKYNSLASANKNNKPLLPRTLTQPSQLQAEISSIRNNTKIKKNKQPQYCYCSLSPTTSDLLKNYQAKHQDKNHKLKDSKESQKNKILQKFKPVQIKKRGQLISNLQSIHLSNKLFFKQVSNPHQNRKNAYILLKHSSKLPSLNQQMNNSSQYLQRVLAKAAQNNAYKRKELKANLQRKELFRLNLLAELTQDKYSLHSKQISLINLNQSYSQQFNASQQWQTKKKMIKSRLGIQF